MAIIIIKTVRGARPLWALETAVESGHRCGLWTSLRELDNIYWFTNSQVSAIARALVTVLLPTLTPGGSIF